MEKNSDRFDDSGTKNSAISNRNNASFSNQNRCEKFCLNPKMSRQNRAKQFAPFSAIKGLSKLLREKEKEHENFLKSKRVWEKFEDNP